MKNASRPTLSSILCPLVAALLVHTGSLPAAAQGRPPRTVVREEHVRRLLTALADDSLEGRATGTRGSARAAAIIATEMRRAGLLPAGDSGYFQRLPIAVVPETGRPQTGVTTTRTAMRLYPSLAALDTVPGARRRTAVNVVGILAGVDSVLRDSAVLIGAHYDHLGVGEAVAGDSTYNGADDNASGTVAILEIARALAAGPRPRRTVVFLATTGEEVGLLGMRWYAAHPVIPLSRTNANLEIEMIGRPDSLAGGSGHAWLTGYERSTMGQTFAAAGLPIGPDRRPEQQFYQRSDNIAFAMAGIPAHTLSSYSMHADYHQPSDDATRIDYGHLTSVIRAAAAATRLLADGPSPQWKPGGRPVASGTAGMLTPTLPTPMPVPTQVRLMTSATPAERLARYTTVRLAADTATLTARERRMLPLLIDAAREMHAIFWQEAYGDRDALLRTVRDQDTRRLVELNVGPWDRLDGNAPFVSGVGPKPPGANFYPRDMTKEELDREIQSGGGRADSLRSLYTMVRRDASGRLVAVPYSRYFAAHNERAALKLREAAFLADDAGLRRYLETLARAVVSDRYRTSDLAWMDMKTNTFDLVLGPIESYEDELAGYKAAHEAFVLVKDQAWSERLAHYAARLPALQRALPVDAAYKRERPGAGAELNAYDVVYVAGQANAGAKTIAINLPNDEGVQLRKGTRRLQLKNAMRAKFDRILLPIAQELIVADQLPRVTFDAFFENVMFHEVAHGLGIKHTINGRGTVRLALKERAAALEEGKADILGLYLVRQLNAQGEMGQEPIENNYVAFLASLFRSIRFGAADAHGRANVVAFNYLRDFGAFAREPNGKYRVNVARMRAGTDALSRDILTLQGNGDYEGAGRLYAERGSIDATLTADLDRLKARGIPVDLVYDQPR